MTLVVRIGGVSLVWERASVSWLPEWGSFAPSYTSCKNYGNGRVEIQVETIPEKKMTHDIKLKNTATSKYNEPDIFIRDRRMRSHHCKVTDLKTVKD